MFYIIKPGTNFDFVGKRKLWLGISALAVVGTIFLLAAKGLNWGIDFTGGAEIQVKIPPQWGTTELRENLSQGGIKGLKIVQVGEKERNEYFVRAQGDENSLKEVTTNIRNILSQSFKPGEFEIEREDIVGPAAGALLRQKGFLAMFYALLVILIYVAIRFDSRYAPGAVMALFHDSMILLGVYAITGRQFDLTILAALLALVGYSNNDTIIVYDRVRETIHLHPEYSIEKAVNSAINETLGRTLVTSLTTFLVVLSLWIFGGPVLENFSFALMVGVIVGTYSSIFIASSLIIMITKYQKKKKSQPSHKKKPKRQYQVRPEPKIQSDQTS